MSSTGPINAVPSADDNTPLSTDNTNIAAVPLPNSPNSVSDGSHASPIPSPEDLLPTIRQYIVFALASSGRDEYRDFDGFINLALAAFLIYGFVLPCLLGYESKPAGAGALGFYLGVIYLVALIHLVALTGLVYERVKILRANADRS